jgi:hypothetical protein
MFVKNYSSIKRDIIKVRDEIKIALVRKGFNPISKDGDDWIYLSNDTIKSIIGEYKGGDD